MSNNTFFGMPVQELVIVDDHRFVLEDTNEKVDVRPVSMERLLMDREKLAKQKVYLFPQQGDIARNVFLVYYDRNIDLEN